MIEFRYFAASVMLVMSLAVICLNGLVIHRMYRECEGFHKICINKAIANILIATAFLVWAAPCSFLNYLYLPDYFNVFFGQIVGWGPYLMSGPFTQLCLTVNRAVAVSCPYWFNKKHKFLWTKVSLGGLWMLSIVMSLPAMMDGCSYIFFVESVSWSPTDTICSRNLSQYVTNLVLLMAIISLSINMITIIKIAIGLGGGVMDQNLSKTRKRKRRNMFIQCVIQDCTHTTDCMLNTYVYTFYSAQWFQFLCGAVSALTVVMMDGGENPPEKLFHDKMMLMETGEENAFIHSAYYYEDSKSLGKNAVAIVATMHKGAVTDLNEYVMRVVGTNSTRRVVTEAKLSTEQDPEESCEYTTVLIQANTVDSMSKLEFETRTGMLELLFSKQKMETPKPVVFCIAPLFAAEQWQSLLTQLHVTKKFGAHLHVYMMTMLENYYQMVREMGELGLMSTQSWHTVKFSQVARPFLEPSRNMELRNPAAAFTDCLLQYKEAAQFVGFMEIEDLLFPVNANYYYEEFEREYEGSMQISALYYQIVEEQSVKYASPDQQSLRALLANAQPGETLRRGRSIVRTERYNSTWTHYSTQAERQPIYLSEQGEQPHHLSKKAITTNAFLRFKNLQYGTEDQLNATVIPQNPMSQDSLLLNEEALKEIEEGIRETLLLPTLQEFIKKLPTEDFYSTKLRECLDEQKSGKGYCVNTKSCKLPSNDKIPCRHSDGLYHSGRIMKPYTWHFVTEFYFTRNLGCYE
ncbi:hypothetical protein L5515_006930 [Caenorhabditis briggsae]|uniref:7TM GPCR serpentine receptor class x (Srx) domain-containing protein n=2 Tax=Caenorhabditis briggsae TaxID=6238 RepID=A0AAE9EX40_CAEBR|nr:hypothetical protein L5515_006930 [Caenorhabditis briggsae]